MPDTERLVLRRWRDSDLDALVAIYGDPQVMAFIGDGSVRTPAETATALAKIEHDWDERGFGLFAVDVRESGELAGWVGLAVPNFLPEVLPAVEIGWRLGRAHWGRGYATEAAREVVRFAFDDAGLDRIVSICHHDNKASAAVMTKLGMRQYLETVVPSHGRPVRVFEMSNGARQVTT